MKNICSLSILLILISAEIFGRFQQNIDQPPYKNPSLPIDVRVEDLIKRMTLEEKIDLLSGTGFATKPNERLGIPELRMTDGPLGVRWDKSTAFPSGISIASSFDPDIAFQIGAAIGREVKGHDRHVILGPCVNIARIPQGGRNFESYGEDPFLASRMAVSYIKGVQSENVAATVKHFACNNQEHERLSVDTKVDERALEEIYFPAFKASVKEADVLCVMNAYNKVNGHFASENDFLLSDKLKKEWGFNWLVMSDWGAVHSTLPTAKGGMDLEMPDGKYLKIKALKNAIEKGKVSLATIEDKVRRILRVIFKLGLFEKPSLKDESLIGSKENIQIALDAARSGIVLLKNSNNLLPLDFSKINSIALIGPNAKVARTGGGGSSQVDPISAVSPFDFLMENFGDKIKINYAAGSLLDGEATPVPAINLSYNGDEGLKGEYFSNKNLIGKPAFTRIDKQLYFNWGEDSPAENFPADKFSVRWTGVLKVQKAGIYTLDINSDDGIRFYVDGKLLIDNWTDHAPESKSVKLKLVPGAEYKIKIEYYENGGGAVCKFGWLTPGENSITSAVNAAKNSDVVLLFAGTSNNYESEGFDRESLALPNEQDELIEAVLNANDNTIVIINSGSPVLMNKWIDKARAVLISWFGGSEMTRATFDVLSGNYNPSGKLPITFPKRWEDCSAYGLYKQKAGITEYKDGIYVGYRHFEKNKIAPLFPFGYGLSYTTFSYSNLKVTRTDDPENLVKVTFDLENTGKIAGAEVAQIYVNDVESTLDRPFKELKGFRKVFLNPGESKTIEITLNKDAFSYYNPELKYWTLESGDFNILVGSSSADIKLAGKITL